MINVNPDLIKHLYAKYSPDVNVEEKLSYIQENYGDDQESFVRHFYAKYAPNENVESKLEYINKSYPVKKKGESTSQGTDLDGEQGQEGFSLVGPENSSDLQTPIEAGGQDFKESSTGEPVSVNTDQYKQAELDQLSDNIEKRGSIESDLLNNYNKATSLNNEDLEVLKTDAQEMLAGESTSQKLSYYANKASNVFGKIATLGMSNNRPIDKKEYYNEKKEEAEKYFKSKKITATESQINEKIQELAFNDSKEGLIAEKNKEYLSNLSDEDKKQLNIDTVYNYKTIEMKEKLDFMGMELDLKNLKKIEKKLKYIEENTSPNTDNEEAYNNYVQTKNQKINYRNSLIKKLQGFEKKYQSDSDKKIDALEAIDYIKRNYGLVDNLLGTFAIAYGDTFIKGSYGAGSYLENIRAEITGSESAKKNSKELSDKAQEVSDTSNRLSNTLAKRLEYNQINDLSDAGYFVAQEVTTQIPTFMALSNPLGGAVGMGSLIAGSTGGKFVDMVAQEENSLFPKNYSTSEKIIAPAISGFSEILGLIPTLKILKRIKGGRVSGGMFDTGVKKYAKTVYEDLKNELPYELATGLVQNAVSMSLGDNIAITEGFDKIAASTIASTFGLTNIGSLPGVLTRQFGSTKKLSEIDKNQSKILRLRELLNKTEVVELKESTQKRIEKLESSNSKIAESIKKDVTSIKQNIFDKVVEITKEQSNIKFLVEKVKKDKNLSSDEKKAVIKEYSDQFKNLEDARVKINDGKGTYKDFLSDDDVISIQDRAIDEISKEKGLVDTGTYSIKEEEIDAKAQEIYESETKSTETTNKETKPEVLPREDEIKEPKSKEQEVVGEKISEVESKKADSTSLSMNPISPTNAPEIGNPFNKRLSELGYNDADISKMTMEQKQSIVESKTSAPTAESSSKVDIEKENKKQERIAEAFKKIDEEESSSDSDFTISEIEKQPTQQGSEVESKKSQIEAETKKLESDRDAELSKVEDIVSTESSSNESLDGAERDFFQISYAEDKSDLAQYIKDDGLEATIAAHEKRKAQYDSSTLPFLFNNSVKETIDFIINGKKKSEVRTKNVGEINRIKKEYADKIAALKQPTQQGSEVESAQDLTPEQKKEGKPKIKLSFVTKSEMTKSENLNSVVSKNNKIKEEYKEVKKLIDCLWK